MSSPIGTKYFQPAPTIQEVRQLKQKVVAQQNREIAFAKQFVNSRVNSVGFKIFSGLLLCGAVTYLSNRNCVPSAIKTYADIALTSAFGLTTGLLSFGFQTRSKLNKETKQIVDEVNRKVVNIESEIPQKKEGIALFVTAQKDHNGALNSIGTARFKIDLAEKFVVQEKHVSSVDELRRVVEQTAKKFPAKSIKALIIQGHGMADMMRLGSGIKGNLTGLEILSPTFNLIDDKAPIILHSCSTGKESWLTSSYANIGGVAQRLANMADQRLVYAPTQDAYSIWSKIAVSDSPVKLSPTFGNKEGKNITQVFKMTTNQLDPTKLIQNAVQSTLGQEFTSWLATKV